MEDIKKLKYIRKLKEENESLKRENEELRAKLSKSPADGGIAAGESAAADDSCQQGERCSQVDKLISKLLTISIDK